jgi:hypothetical protein
LLDGPLRDPVQFHDAGVEILVPVSPVSAAAYDKLLENVARALAAKGIPVEPPTRGRYGCYRRDVAPETRPAFSFA